MADGLETGFLLDRQWYRLRGEMERTKHPTLLLLARTLDQARAPHAVIGGVALQIHQAEPRTTLDLDVAVPSLTRCWPARSNAPRRSRSRMSTSA